MSIPYVSDVNYTFVVGDKIPVNITIPGSPNTAVFSGIGNFYVAPGTDVLGELNSITYANATVTFTVPVANFSPTRLAPGFTYTATITVDGGTTQNISVIGKESQSFSDLIYSINKQITGGSFAISNLNQLVFTDSNPLPQSGTVVLTAGTLFPALANYVSITNTPGSIATGAFLNPQKLVLPGSPAATTLSFIAQGSAIVSVAFSTSSIED
jgi:hypothetical protein